MICQGNHRLGNQEQLPLFIGHDDYWPAAGTANVIFVAESIQALLRGVSSMTLCGDEHCRSSSQLAVVRPMSENAPRLHTLVLSTHNIQ